MKKSRVYLTKEQRRLKEMAVRQRAIDNGYRALTRDEMLRPGDLVVEWTGLYRVHPNSYGDEVDSPYGKYLRLAKATVCIVRNG